MANYTLHGELGHAQPVVSMSTLPGVLSASSYSVSHSQPAAFEETGQQHHL